MKSACVRAIALSFSEIPHRGSAGLGIIGTDKVAGRMPESSRVLPDRVTLALSCMPRFTGPVPPPLWIERHDYSIGRDSQQEGRVSKRGRGTRMNADSADGTQMSVKVGCRSQAIGPAAVRDRFVRCLALTLRHGRGDPHHVLQVQPSCCRQQIGDLVLSQVR